MIGEKVPKITNELNGAGLPFEFYKNMLIPNLDQEQQAQQDACTNFIKSIVCLNIRYSDSYGQAIPWPDGFQKPEYVTLHVYYGYVDARKGKVDVRVPTGEDVLAFMENIIYVLNYGTLHPNYSVASTYR